MRFEVSGRHIDIGDALRSHAEQELGAVIDKYARRPTDAQLMFSRSGSENICEATVHLSTGLTAQATGKAHEIYAALDACCARLEKQLRRYKRRLKDHHRTRSKPVEDFGGSAYILAHSEEQEEVEPETLAPVVIAEMETRVPSLSVGEAVMQLELSESALLVFRNESHSGVNVVYRREDGNVGWIDPRNCR